MFWYLMLLCYDQYVYIQIIETFNRMLNNGQEGDMNEK